MRETTSTDGTGPDGTGPDRRDTDLPDAARRPVPPGSEPRDELAGRRASKLLSQQQERCSKQTRRQALEQEPWCGATLADGAELWWTGDEPTPA